MTQPSAGSPTAELRTLFRDTAEQWASDAEVAWYAARLPRDRGPILDAMSGSGRLLVPLLAAGFQVHGAEASAAQLARCHARLQSCERAAELFRQSVAVLNLPFRYAAAFVSGGAFQLIVDPATAFDALLRIRAHLVLPATLIVELFVPAAARHPPGAPVVEVSTLTPVDGCRIGMRSETSFDIGLKRADVVRRYERRERHMITRREDESLSFTWYSEEEALALLETAGYRDIRVESPPRAREGEHRFAVIARGA